MSAPKKSLGQHWLKSPEILASIVQTADIQPADHVLEIGPGQGDLTQQLLQTGATITALEFDQDLIAPLTKRFGSRITLRHGDILRFNFSELPAGYYIVANIPYYLTSHLVRILCETTNPPVRAVLLVQKEVARRLAAAPGDMSLLSVSAQLFFDVWLGLEVPAHHFTPPPKVDSQVVMLQRLSAPRYEGETARIIQLAKAGFAGKRKMLRNALNAGLRAETALVEHWLQKANIDPSARAQMLSLDDWHRLSRIVPPSVSTNT